MITRGICKGLISEVEGISAIYVVNEFHAIGTYRMSEMKRSSALSSN